METIVASPGSLKDFAARHGMQPRDPDVLIAYSEQLAAYRNACLGGMAIVEVDNVAQGEQSG